jgi:hypothetical protein
MMPELIKKVHPAVPMKRAHPLSFAADLSNLEIIEFLERAKLINQLVSFREEIWHEREMKRIARESAQADLDAKKIGNEIKYLDLKTAKWEYEQRLKDNE